MTRTRISTASVVFKDGTYIVCRNEDEVAIFRSLMGSLGPIETHKVGNLKDREYDMTFLGGKEPGMIFVKVGQDNRLEYQWGNFVYTGGDSSGFIRISEAMRKLRATRVDDQLVERLP